MRRGRAKTSSELHRRTSSDKKQHYEKNKRRPAPVTDRRQLKQARGEIREQRQGENGSTIEVLTDITRKAIKQ